MRCTSELHNVEDVPSVMTCRTHFSRTNQRDPRLMTRWESGSADSGNNFLKSSKIFETRTNEHTIALVFTTETVFCLTYNSYRVNILNKYE